MTHINRARVLAASVAIASAPAFAQSGAVEAKAEDSTAMAVLEGVLVTATKKSTAEQLQDVPASITAYGAQQMEAMQFRNLESLTFSMPNVALDQLGTQKGIANFSIRGLGVNSSVPSIEPTVGTFVDGMYLGTNFGVVLDTFDLESVEVLRGPQGVLFGRNVTGGAVVMRTARPDGEFKVNGRASFESGTNQTYAGSVEGSLVEDRLFGKISGYFNDDGGYFENITSGRDDGQNETWFIRPTLVWEAGDAVQFTLIGETGKLTGDGPVARNPEYATEFETAQDFPGTTDLEHDSVVLETTIDVSFGDGTITNILGYRQVEQFTHFDVDGAPQDVYGLYYYFEQDQLSNELRYAGRFNRLDLVTGLYWFTQDMNYLIRDELFFANVVGDYGGIQDQTSIGVFINGDFSFTDHFTLGIGGRYARDEKKAQTASRSFAQPQPCDIEIGSCTVYNFAGKKTFDSFTPRVMLKYGFNEDVNVYTSFTRGFRSGGFNIRSASAAAPPGPFGDESSDSYEIGLKSTFMDGKGHLNASAFYNDVSDLQRETSISTPAGFVTTLGNAADARIQGVELELAAMPVQGLVLRGSVGYTDGEYTRVFGDLNSDGVVNDLDQALKIPRLAELTYSIGAFYDAAIGNFGDLELVLTLDHRDESFFNDANTGPLPAVDYLFANVAITPAALSNVTFSLYGKNLLDEWNTGNNTPLGTLPSGGAIQFSTKGRVYGVEITARF